MSVCTKKKSKYGKKLRIVRCYYITVKSYLYNTIVDKTIITTSKAKIIQKRPYYLVKSLYCSIVVLLNIFSVHCYYVCNTIEDIQFADNYMEVLHDFPFSAFYLLLIWTTSLDVYTYTSICLWAWISAHIFLSNIRQAGCYVTPPNLKSFLFWREGLHYPL